MASRWVLLLVSGCRLNFDVLPDTSAPDTKTIPLCDVSDARLMACYRFEQAGVDSSVHANHATPVGVTFVSGVVGMAAQLAVGSSLSVPESATLDFTTGVTLEAWVWPASSSVGTQYILDSDNQYGLWSFDGRLGCSLVPYGTFDAPDLLPLQTWTHVACTYDGSAVRLWVDGSEVAMTPQTGPLDQSSTTGITLGADNPSGGEELIGLIDEVAIWRGALTAPELCASAGSCL